MKSYSCSATLFASHRHPGIWHSFSVLCVFIVWAIALPDGACGQMREERDLDDPPMELAAEAPEETKPDLSEVVQRIVEKTNEFRREHDLGAVGPDKQLKETAQYFADFMARTGKYGHIADGNTPANRAEKHDYDYCLVSENIAYQFRSTGFAADELAERFVTGWKESPEHRENMLDPDVMEIGVAVARAEDSPTYFGVQMFGRPQAAAISFQVSNEAETDVKYTVRRNGSDRSFTLAPRQRRSHQRCRPAEVEFPEPKAVHQVEDGAHYVVRPAPDGTLQVANRPPD